MRRFLLLVLAALMLLSFSACGEKSKVPTADTKQEDASRVVHIGRTLIESGGIRITALDFNPEGTIGPEVSFLIENGSESNISVFKNCLCVNDMAVSGSLFKNVAKGESEEGVLMILPEDLEEAGITGIKKIEVRFRASDEDKKCYIFTSELLPVWESEDAPYSFEYNESGLETFGVEGVRITAKGINYDGISGTEARFMLFNGSGRDVTVQVRNEKVNGSEIKGVFSCELPAGKYAFDDLIFKTDDLKAIGVDSIDEIELCFYVASKADGAYKHITTGPVTIVYTDAP